MDMCYGVLMFTIYKRIQETNETADMIAFAFGGAVGSQLAMLINNNAL